MRVLMLSKACLVGIYQKKMEYIAQHPDVTALEVLVPPTWQDERGVMPLERAYTDGYRLTETAIRLNGNFHLHYYPEFKTALTTFKPDVVHIDEEPYNLSTWLALRVAQQYGARSLFFSWQNIERQYPFPFSWIERYVLNHIDYAIMGTQSAADVWRAKGYTKPYAVIPQFGVDTDLFKPLEPKPERPLQIGYIGRLVPEKGIDTLFHALDKLKNESWELHLVGGGTIKQALITLANELGISERVHFQDQVPSLEMPAHYQQLDVLVLPSRTKPNWKEQFGRVLVEAMASGVVVVGSDSGAIPGVIGEAGMVFPEDNASALKDCLLTLIKKPEHRHTLVEKGIKRVQAQFTQAQVANQMVDAYRATINA